MPIKTRRPGIAAWGFSLALLMLPAARAQNPFILADASGRETSAQELRAEDRIQEFMKSGDIQGLASYAQAVVDSAREKNALIDRQKAIIIELEASRAETVMVMGKALQQIGAIQQAIQIERVEREKMLDQINALNEPSWKRQLQAAGNGATVGGAIGRNVSWALIGSGAGWFIEWVSTRKEKPQR